MLASAKNNPTGRVVPVFNDKHLSYNWADAAWMYDRARELGVPFQSGSSLPFTWRKPWLVRRPSRTGTQSSSLSERVSLDRGPRCCRQEHPLGVELDEAVIVGYSTLDSFADHALEALGCMVERRQGGESGVRTVRYLEGPAVWDAGERGEWSRPLAEAALACIGGGADGESDGGADGGGYGRSATMAPSACVFRVCQVSA